jgi:hypothetical protein
VKSPLESFTEKYLEAAFCEVFRENILEHLASCEECQKGVASLLDNFPMLSILTGGRDVKELLSSFKGKGGGNGKNAV